MGEGTFGIFEQLANYGVLGLLTLGLGFVVWFLLKRQLSAEDLLRTRVDQLQQDLANYIRDDRDRVSSALENNTKALNDLHTTILRGK